MLYIFFDGIINFVDLNFAVEGKHSIWHNRKEKFADLIIVISAQLW